MERIGDCKRIPKIVHQIWLGPREMPNEWMSGWREFCKQYGWEYKLWTDSDMTFLINQEIFDNSKTYQMKSDIARYEILYNHGGLYVDCDMIWLGKDISLYIPLDKNMFIGIQEFPSPADIGYHNLCNGMFASPKGHNILKRCISKIPEYSKDVKRKKTGAWAMSGPCLLNNCIMEPIIVVPYKYIFPVDFHYKQGINDPSIYKNDSLVFTYNGNDYPGITYLDLLSTSSPESIIFWVVLVVILLLILFFLGYNRGRWSFLKRI